LGERVKIGYGASVPVQLLNQLALANTLSLATLLTKKTQAIAG